MGHFPWEWKRLVWQVYPHCAVCGKYISEDALLAVRLIEGHAIYRVHASPMHMALVHKECHYTTNTYGRSSPDDPLEYLFSQGEPPVRKLSDWFRE